MEVGRWLCLTASTDALLVPYPSRPELPAQQSVFDDQVGEDFTFAALKPTGEHPE
jgi:hypothetical protein